MHWIVQGDYYLTQVDGVTHEDHYPFTLDASQTHIDVNHHDTPEGTYGGKLKGIYEVTGDSLKVCYDLKALRNTKSSTPAVVQGKRQAMSSAEP